MKSFLTVGYPKTVFLKISLVRQKCRMEWNGMVQHEWNGRDSPCRRTPEPGPRWWDARGTGTETRS